MMVVVVVVAMAVPRSVLQAVRLVQYPMLLLLVQLLRRQRLRMPQRAIVRGLHATQPLEDVVEGRPVRGCSRSRRSRMRSSRRRRRRRSRGVTRKREARFAVDVGRCIPGTNVGADGAAVLHKRMNARAAHYASVLQARARSTALVRARSTTIIISTKQNTTKTPPKHKHKNTTTKTQQQKRTPRHALRPAAACITSTSRTSRRTTLPGSRRPVPALRHDRGVVQLQRRHRTGHPHLRRTRTRATGTTGNGTSTAAVCADAAAATATRRIRGATRLRRCCWRRYRCRRR